MVVDAASRHNRNRFAIFLRVFFNQRDNSPHFLVIFRLMECLGCVRRVYLQLGQLLTVKSQMSARQRSLNDHQIRCGLVLAVPHPADDRRRLNGGNDRRNLRRRPFHILRQGNRKSCARYDQVSARLDRRFNVLRIVFRRHHDIKAHDAALRDRARLLQL